MADGDLVLVTGVSGFVARHVAAALLRAGYRVRGTVRHSAKHAPARRSLEGADVDLSRLEIAAADLGEDAGWDAALAGCRFALHVASPFPRRLPSEKFGLVEIARGGTLRVLRAAERAGVERVVVTSSVAAVYYGHEDRVDPTFTEADFSNVASPAIGAYAVSKTLAEQAAWDFAASARLQLATINPSFVLGPLLGGVGGTSVSLIRMMMQGRMPLVPRIVLGVVDVRDVATAHVRALEVPEAAGRRFIASAGSLSLMEIAKAVGGAVPSVRRRLPKATLPDFVIRMAARFSPEAAQAVAELGRTKRLVADPAQNILGVSFLPPKEAVAATARGLLEHDPAREGAA